MVTFACSHIRTMTLMPSDQATGAMDVLFYSIALIAWHIPVSMAEYPIYAIAGACARFTKLVRNLLLM